MPNQPRFLLEDATDPGLRSPATLICFSHLRWDFVFQRPQHLMSRFAKQLRVLFWEEPRLLEALAAPRLDVAPCALTGVVVVTPELRLEDDRAGDRETLEYLLDGLLEGEHGPILRWYYTPMMLPFSQHVQAECVVYDCMDELAAFKFAPPEIEALEARLLGQADIVFTGGHSLYEAKKGAHANMHPFPSAVDIDHFAAARAPGLDPDDQASLARPILGYYGVIDERIDLALVAALADARPEASIVMLGPLAKLEEVDLPRRPNLHYLGRKQYRELPDYLRGWDVALMPFAINAATRFISPTKTPEYLAAGCPVVSTPVVDVVRHYGELEAVRIAGDAERFARACDEALVLARDPRAWRAEADEKLAGVSWDATFAEMSKLIDEVRSRRAKIVLHGPAVARPLGVAGHYDVMVVGAGFAGAVMAERLAAGSGKKVLVVDRRPHIAGNAFDRLDAAGILIHQYGPHIFHTNSDDIVAYLSRFTGWRPYEHRVLAEVDGMRVPMPINRTTLNMLYGLDLTTEAETELFLASRAEPVADIRTSADVVISRVGRELYEKFFQGYTRKQWGIDPSGLDKSVTSRVPTRATTDDRYFTDSFQAMPDRGYSRMFERMLDHPGIDLTLGVEYEEARASCSFDHLVFTGPIDEYFGHRFGPLPYRSLRFEHCTIDREWFQEVAVVNYPALSTPFTRVTEYKHLTGQRAPVTSVTYEHPSALGDPYYPIPREENQKLFKRYQALALAEPGVSFVGRLATYRYYNMDQVVGQALAAWRRLAPDLGLRGEHRAAAGRDHAEDRAFAA